MTCDRHIELSWLVAVWKEKLAVFRPAIDKLSLTGHV